MGSMPVIPMPMEFSAKRTAQSHRFLNSLPKDSTAITYPNIKLKRSDKFKYLKCFIVTARKVCFCSGYSAQSYALHMLLFWSVKLYSKSWHKLTWEKMVGFGGVLFCFTASSKVPELNSPYHVVNCLRPANAWLQGDTELFRVEMAELVITEYSKLEGTQQEH